MTDMNQDVCATCSGSGFYRPNGLRWSPCLKCHPRRAVNVIAWIQEAATAIDRAYGPQAQLPKESQKVIDAVIAHYEASRNMLDALFEERDPSTEYAALSDALVSIGGAA